MKRYVIADIHGNHKALKQVLKRGKFDYKKDLLIVLGDIVDGFCDAYECVEELLKIKNIIYVIGNHDCIEENTEVLTLDGWKKAKDISNEKIANFHIKTGKITYDKPLAKIPLHKDKGITIEGYATKQCITLGHNVVLDNKKVKASTLNTEEKINSLRFRHFGEVNNKGIDISDDYLRFLVWIICDGCMHSSSKIKKRIQFKLSKKRKIDRLQEILGKLRIGYTFKKATMSSGNKLQPSFIRIYGEEARKVFKILDGRKQFPNWFKDMSKSQAKIFLEELKVTDGHKDIYGKLSMVTINKDDADLIQIIMITNGVPCSIKKINKGSGFKNGKPQYLVTIYKKILNKKCVECKEIGTKKFLCFTMPKGTLITRLDGKTSFTGNCWWMNHIENGWAEKIWLIQCGENTKKSYESHGFKYKSIPKTHIDFFNRGIYYYELDDMLFVHGGFDYPDKMPKDETIENLTWDRELLYRLKGGLKIKEWKKVFIGHTVTENGKPCIVDWYDGKYAKILQVDCGAGWKGKLCLMNIDTEKYFLSDYAFDLNPLRHGK